MRAGMERGTINKSGSKTDEIPRKTSRLVGPDAQNGDKSTTGKSRVSVSRFQNKRRTFVRGEETATPSRIVRSLIE
jgi:hypothetical protein